MPGSARYLLEAHRTPATVVDVAGREREGVFFLRSGGIPAHVESLIDLLNDERKPFLPFDTGDGFELVAAESIVFVAFELPGEEARRLDEIGAVRAAIEVEVVTGQRLSGVLVHEAPVTAHRVSDLLNFTPTRFLTLFGEERAYAVRWRAILSVRPED